MHQLENSGHKTALFCFLAAAAIVPTSLAGATFFSAERFSVPKVTNGIGGIALVDADNDGDLDVLILPVGIGVGEQRVSEPVPVFVYRNDDGEFVEATKKLIRGKLKVINASSQNTVVADFNDDGREDVYLGDGGSDQPDAPGAQNQLLLGTKSGLRLVTKKKYPRFADLTHGTAVGDADADGDLDIFEANLGCCLAFADSRGSGVFLNNGKGKFSWARDALPNGIWNFDGNDVFSLVNTGAFIDFDRDGDNDLLVDSQHILDIPGWAQDQAQILVNDGSGNFLDLAPPDTLPSRGVGLQGSALITRVADFNGDGLPDLAFLVISVDGKDTAIRIALNNGDGTFRNGKKMVPRKPRYERVDFLTVGDINGDGWPDIVFRGDDQLRFIRNVKGKKGKTGKNIFPKQGDGLPILAGHTYLGDVDADGDMDIVTTNGPDWVYLENVRPYKPTPSLKAPRRVKIATEDTGADLGVDERLSWQHVHRALDYRVEVGLGSSFEQVIYKRNGLTGDSLLLPVLPEGHRYFWRVRAHNASGNGEWSEVESFDVD